MGILPHAERSVNKVIKMLDLPCNIDPGIYVEAAFVAIMEAIAEIETPDLREEYTKVRGNSVLCDVKRKVLKPLVGKKLSETPAGRTFFKLVEIFDRSVYWLFIMHVIANGLIDWTQIIGELAGCEDKTNPNVGTGNKFFGAIHDDGSWSTCDFQAGNYSRFYPAWPSNISVRPGYGWTLASTTRFVDFGGVPVPHRMRIINKTTNKVLDQYEVKPNEEGNIPYGHVWHRGINNTNAIQNIWMEYSYVGPPLPFHEAFLTNNSHGFVFYAGP